MSLWPLYRVWNTTDLVCSCHWDTETVREEEEEEEFLSKASTHGQKFYSTHGDNCTSMDLFGTSELKTNLLSAEEIYKEKNNCQSCQ